MVEGLLLEFKKGEIGCFSETIKRLAAIDPDSEISSQELAQIILEDYGLIGKVLHTVNSFYYNRLGHKVATVTQAVILLGFNTIREIALGMAVMDLVTRDRDSKAAKLIARAFVAAHAARMMTKKRGGMEPEEAFLATLFSPLPRIITAVYDPRLYDDLEREEAKGQKGSLTLFWSSLARGLSSMLKLPPAITGNMIGLGGAGTSQQGLHGVVGDATLLASILFDQGDGADRVLDVRNISRRQGLSPMETFELLERSLEKSAGYSESLRALLPGREAMDPIREELALERPHGPPAPEPTEPDQDQEELFLDLLNQISGAVLNRSLSLDQIYLLAAETLQRGVRLDRVLLCLLTRDRRFLVARYGLGHGVARLKQGLQIPFPPKGPPIKPAMGKNSEVMGTWNQVAPRELVGEEGPKLVCVTPLVIGERPIGCFLLDRHLGADKFTPKDLKRIATIRQLVVLATKPG